jgi:hypothetical protein
VCGRDRESGKEVTEDTAQGEAYAYLKDTGKGQAEPRGHADRGRG